VVQGVEGLILVDALFLPRVAPVSQGGFGVMELRLQYSSCHLGSSWNQFFKTLNVE
jgi:hypothetical protein